VKLWTSTLAAGAILAFAAPAGYAATSNIPSDSGSTARLGSAKTQVVANRTVKVRIAAKDAKIKALVTRNNQLRATIKFLVAENKQLSVKLRAALAKPPAIVPAPTPSTTPSTTPSPTPGTGEPTDVALVAGPNEEPVYEDC
jgi:hypothetical protein